MSQFLINENMKMPAEAVAITGGSILGLLLGGTAECRCTSRLIGSFRPSVRRNAKDFGPARKAKDASGPARVASVNVRRGQSARWVCHRAALGGKRAARELRHGPRRRDHRRAALGGAGAAARKMPARPATDQTRRAARRAGVGRRRQGRKAGPTCSSRCGGPPGRPARKEHCDTLFRDPTRCAPIDQSRSDRTGSSSH